MFAQFIYSLFNLTNINYYLLQILKADVTRILHAHLILPISQLSKEDVVCEKHPGLVPHHKSR